MMSALIRIFADNSSIVSDMIFSGCGNKPTDFPFEVGVTVFTGVGVAFAITKILSLRNDISR